ncbi:hypothetical protein [Ktedonospora formicarum]|uniref:Uncharacterized protein n=1 Tax=Ktedonospora formicarum TaxID=2778364 RepID=A0A8J3MWW4_9CHLR|nr:hypothetical protein [Ktedonospora formicarum]GHO50785.1 hypothetical protein KSX_89480 [Ktedonospora formicarum]
MSANNGEDLVAMSVRVPDDPTGELRQAVIDELKEGGIPVHVATVHVTITPAPSGETESTE